MHNLKNVVKFEVLKQIRKATFWIAIFAFPVMMFVFVGISYFGTRMAMEQGEIASKSLGEQIDKIVVVDKTGLIDFQLFEGLPVEQGSDAELELENLKQSRDEKDQALLIYPSRESGEATQIYIKVHQDEAKAQQISGGLSTLASVVLRTSVEKQIAPEILEIIQKNSIITSTKTHFVAENGSIYNPLQKLVVPVIFTAIFFLIIMLTSNQNLVATTEEKENRIAETILTTVTAKTLITGKIIALVVLGLVQILSLILPFVILFWANDAIFQLSPEIQNIISNPSFDFWPTLFGASYLIFGFFMITGFTILIGSFFPTAQDASQFFAPIILLIILPIYFASAIISGSQSIIVYVMSYFPVSAPLTLLLRNASGTLPVSEGLIGLAVLVIFSVVLMLLAVRTFRSGVFEYSKPASLKDAIKRV